MLGGFSHLHRVCVQCVHSVCVCFERGGRESASGRERIWRSTETVRVYPARGQGEIVPPANAVFGVTALKAEWTAESFLRDPCSPKSPPSSPTPQLVSAWPRAPPTVLFRLLFGPT